MRDCSGILNRLFKTAYAHKRHTSAPMLRERQDYLQHLFVQGRGVDRIADTAGLLLHLVCICGLGKDGYWTRSAIHSASERWANKSLPHRPAGHNKKSAKTFYTAAFGFLKFLGRVNESNALSNRFDSAFAEFNRFLAMKGYRPTTIASLSAPARRFLFWVGGRHKRLSSINHRDVTDFMNEGRSRGWRPATVVISCQALRNFFRFAADQGWCSNTLWQTIVNPVVRQRQESTGPRWKDVRRMISSMGHGPSDLRDKPILLLCALYGLRSSEVRQLTLDDLDWNAGTFAVRRAKSSIRQQFPLRQELGMAIVAYLKSVRPVCTCRALFVTLSAPYRSLKNLGAIVKKQMKKANVLSASCGPHSLRHAFSTELLRRGTSLQGIATLLGHKDLRSVSIYAKHDVRSFRQIANFSLEGVA